MVVNRLSRAAAVLGVGAVVMGVVAALVADGGLATRDSSVVGWPQIELQLSRFNRLGGLTTAALGVAAVVAARRRSALGVGVCAGGFAVMAVDVLIQWERGANLFGGSGHTLAFWTGLAAGLGGIAWGLRVARAAS